MACPRIIDWRELELLRELQPEGEADLVEELIGTFLAEATERLQRLQRAVPLAHFDAVAKEAHAIRGSAGLLGAGRLQAVAEELELCARWHQAAEMARLADRVTKALTDVETALAARSLLRVPSLAHVPPAHS